MPRNGSLDPVLDLVAKRLARDVAQQSKTVALHPEGAHHTLGADLPVVVVTEQGVADLCHLNDPERVRAMLGVVHPDWRSSLADCFGFVPQADPDGPRADERRDPITT